MGAAYYIVVNSGAPPFDAFVNGKFIADETSQINKLLKGFSEKCIDDYLSYSKDTIKEMMEEAGFGPDNRLQTTIAVRSAAPEKRREPAAMQQMWSEIYVDIEIVQSDAAVFYRTVQENDFDLATAGWSADLPR